jgi:lipid-A-disaccharide synthase
VQVAVGVASNLGTVALRKFIPPGSSIALLEHASHELMRHADAAIVTSGTATLETGWYATPLIVVYKTSWPTYLIGRLLVHLPYIGLVNIVAGKAVVPEFIQSRVTTRNLVEAVRRILEDERYAAHMKEELSVIKTRLGHAGASARVAESIIALGEAA